MANLANGKQMPLGLGMAMSKNLDAMNYFSTLDSEKQSQIIDHTHEINSKKEMQSFVNSMFNSIS